MDLQFYIDKVGDAAKVKALQEQWFAAANLGFLKCAGCGQQRHLTLAYKCLYCGCYFCFGCAEIHFGKTVADYYKEKKCQP